MRSAGDVRLGERGAIEGESVDGGAAVVLAVPPRQLRRPVVAPAYHHQRDATVVRHEGGRVPRTCLEQAGRALGDHVAARLEVEEGEIAQITLDEAVVRAVGLTSVAAAEEEQRRTDEGGGVASAGRGLR